MAKVSLKKSWRAGVGFSLKTCQSLKFSESDQVAKQLEDNSNNLMRLMLNVVLILRETLNSNPKTFKLLAKISVTFCNCTLQMSF